jgi:GTPase involved in cell partitioning and DNA repair
MTNNQNQNGGFDPNGHHIAMEAQEFLNFLGHITQATVIAAVTAGSMREDIDKIEDLLSDGKVDEALKELQTMKRGMVLISKTVCKVGSELTEHDQKICEGCEAKGMEVESVTATHIQRFQQDTKGFIDEFFQATPHTKIVKPPEGKPDKPDDTGPKSRLN